MLSSSKFRYAALTWRRLNRCQLRTATSPAGTEESVSESDPMKARMLTDPNDRRGYKYDETLDLTALIDKASAMGYINTADADGFKAKNFRTGAEPPDPEKAKEIMVFFKNRPKPKKPEREHSERNRYASRDTNLDRSKDVDCPNRIRMPPNSQHPTRQNAAMRKMHCQPSYNGPSLSKSNFQPPRGNYKLSKLQKK